MDYPVFPGLLRIPSRKALRPMLAAGILLAALLPAPFAVSAAPREILQKRVDYPDGKTKESYGYYLDDKKHEVRDGLDEEFYPSGAKKGHLTWQDGKENGAVVYYYADGRKSYEANYRNGKKNGYATVWYPTGQKQWQTVFREGQTHGVWREWYVDGKKKFEANYGDGKLDGLATWWHETGRLWQERSFQEGVLVQGSVREWDKAGRQTFPPPETQGSASATPAELVKQDTTAAGNAARAGN